jgi:hypothetical protein
VQVTGCLFDFVEYLIYRSYWHLSKMLGCNRHILKGCAGVILYINPVLPIYPIGLPVSLRACSIDQKRRDGLFESKMISSEDVAVG